MRDIIDLSQISKEEFDEIYNLACEIMDKPSNYIHALEGKVMASLFFEPSTRTNLSFATAISRLGGKVIGFSDANSSSTAKGESLKDTIKVISKYADFIVMRNPCEGSALAASMYSEVPVINAGDGGHFHPTQTLTDLITIKKYRGSLDNMTIGLCGDLKYGRTVHSLIKSLAQYKNIKFVLISPKELVIPKYIYDFMNSNNLEYTVCTDLLKEIPNLDVLYMTRVQKERFDDILEYERLKDIYILDVEKMKLAKENMLILHPLPRVDEIADEVDDDPRAVYFEQALYGMYGRMALMLTILSKNEREKPHPIQGIKSDKVCSNHNCITHTQKYLPILNEEICPYCDKEMTSIK